MLIKSYQFIFNYLSLTFQNTQILMILNILQIFYLLNTQTAYVHLYIKFNKNYEALYLISAPKVVSDMVFITKQESY